LPRRGGPGISAKSVQNVMVDGRTVNAYDWSMRKTDLRKVLSLIGVALATYVMFLGLVWGINLLLFNTQTQPAVTCRSASVALRPP
jgi:hypothetical protein